jgi:hypothetical protein
MKAIAKRSNPQNQSKAIVAQRKPLHSALGVPVQRQGPEEDEEKWGRQAKSAPGVSNTLQAKADLSSNNTGLPDTLKAGIESLSGLAMDDVRVHYNSTKPALVQALAYTRGPEIHVGPGQERHLPHEAWHVVQQKQGRVMPTIQAKGVAINDNPHLEKEADIMGTRAQRWDGRGLQTLETPAHEAKLLKVSTDSGTPTLQRAVGYEFETGYPLLNPNLAGIYTPKNQTVIEANNKKWKAVGDSGVMEFVTVPVSETLDGSYEAFEIVADMAEFALHIEKLINRGTAYRQANFYYRLKMKSTDKDIDYSKFNTVLSVAGADRTYTSIRYAASGQSVKAAKPDLELADAKTHRMMAAPQATAGIRTEMIPELFETIAEKPQLVRFELDREVLELSALLARRACKAYFIDPHSKFVGFLALVFSYLRIPVEYAKLDKGPAKYPKDMPILSRTNMGTLASEVIETREQNDFFENLQEVLMWSGVSGGLQDPLFPYGYKMANKIEPGPTRLEWLRALNEGTDWFAGHSNPGQSAMGSMGLGRQSADPFYHQRKDRTILEFRRIKGPVHASDWPKLALDIFWEIMKINRTI